MRKILLGTTALVATGLVAAPAVAQLELDIDAKFYWEVGFKDDGVDDDDDFDFQNEGEMQFTFTGTADNGLRYGFQFDLDDIASNDGVEVDETFLFVEGNFGRIEVGDNDGAHGNLRVFIPTVGIGGIDGGFNDYVGIGGTLKGDNAFDTDDATKILYQTTGIDLGGFVFGVSYAPGLDEGNTVDVDRDVDDFAAIDDDLVGAQDAFENGIEVGAFWKGAFGDFEIEVGGGYTYLSANGTSEESIEDVNSFTIGGNVGYGGFTLGAQFAYNGESASGIFIDDLFFDLDSDDVAPVGLEHEGFWRVSAGATYEVGPWGFGINGYYATIEEVTLPDNLFEAGIEEYAIGGSIAYSLVPGFEVAADLVYFDYDEDLRVVSPLIDVEELDNDNDGIVGILRTTIEF